MLNFSTKVTNFDEKIAYFCVIILSKVKMDIESVREYCLSLPQTSEDMAFGEDYLLLRVCGKIFACYSFVGNDTFVVKCDPDYAVDLKDAHPEIEPAWHWNKKYWIQFSLRSRLGADFVKSLIRHSYSEVVKKMTKKMKNEYPEILNVME
jgi:predicted DNA-binding protein (MmcQ/YjbR family)